MDRETTIAATNSISGLPVLVSIIIPCYNHEKYIEHTLNSVVADSYPHKEIIIINDGSTDDSDLSIREWVSAAAQKGSVIYINRPNKGICATLNEMIDLSGGKYILPLASDDCLYGDTIAKRVQILEERPDKSVLLNDAFVIDDDDNIIMQSSSTDYWKADKSSYYDDEAILKSCIKAPRIAGPVIFYRKSIFNQIGKYPEDIQFEDWYFYQRAACKYLILFVDIKVALYRVHGGNYSGVNSPHGLKIARSTLKVYQRNFWFYPGIKYKLLGLKCYLRVLAWYIKLKFKSNRSV
ncbi:MAG: glycosyltransferase [Chitinophagaceae bacterium]|nr:glycosyltransferase [Chitinophagaceae bacterium]